MPGLLTLKSILRLAAVGLVLATLCALLARSWWVFDLFSHSRLQNALAALTLGVVALMLWAWPLAAIPLAIALLQGWMIRALWLAETPDSPALGMPLRLATAMCETPSTAGSSDRQAAVEFAACFPQARHG